MCGNSQPIAVTFGIPLIVNGNGAPPAAPAIVSGDLRVDHPFSISGWSLMADQAGNAQVDIWIAPWVAGLPPTVANSIVAAAPPKLTAQESAHDSTLVGWTKAFGAGPWWIRWHLDSIATINFFTLQLTAKRTIGV